MEPTVEHTASWQLLRLVVAVFGVLLLTVSATDHKMLTGRRYLHARRKAQGTQQFVKVF